MHSTDQYAAARRLLEARIWSSEEVDVLLVLRSSERAWSVPELQRATQHHPELVRSALMSLLSHGLIVVRRDGYLYGPCNLALDGAIGELERLSCTDRAELLAMLASTALQRIRVGVSELLVEALRRKLPSTT